MENAEALFLRKEELNPELVPYVQKGPLGLMIHHPVIIQIMYHESSNAWVNEYFKHASQRVQEAREAKDWEKFVFAHERPYRLNALLEAYNAGLTFEKGRYWGLVGEVWVDSENIYQNLKLWRHIWSRPCKQQMWVMGEDDRLQHDSLPSEFTIYRGTNYKSSVRGLSWTLDPDKAEWFARRFKTKKNSIIVVSAQVRKICTLAYFGSRNEQEIVVDPLELRNMKVIKNEKA